MRAAVLIFALAVFTGCDARAVRQADATTAGFEATISQFLEQIGKLGTATEDAINIPQLAETLDTLTKDAMSELDVYKGDIETFLSNAQELRSQMTEDMQLLINKLRSHMMDAKEHSIQSFNDLHSALQENTEDGRARLNTYIRKLKKRLNKDTEEIHNTATAYLTELRSRSTQNFDTVREKIGQFVSHGELIREKLRNITSSSTLAKLKTDGLMSKLQALVEDLKDQLQKTAEELGDAVPGKLDEVTDGLSSMVAQVRDQFPTIMEKVKETATA